MSDDSEPEVDLFYAVCRTDPARRTAFLDQACASRLVLRARVEELLAVHDEAERFFVQAERATGLPINAH